MNNQEIADNLIENQKRAIDAGDPPFADLIEHDGRILASAANDSLRGRLKSL